MDDVHSYSFSFDPEFEFEAKMPEELLVRAMNSTRPIFLTDTLMAKVARTSPQEVVRQMVNDLHRNTDPNDTSDVLRWHYLFTDFEHDFPRMLLMQAAKLDDDG